MLKQYVQYIQEKTEERHTYMNKRTNSSNEGTVQWRGEVLERHLEIESALVFTDLECITVAGCFWDHTLHLLLL